MNMKLSSWILIIHWEKVEFEIIIALFIAQMTSYLILKYQQHLMISDNLPHKVLLIQLPSPLHLPFNHNSILSTSSHDWWIQNHILILLNTRVENSPTTLIHKVISNHSNVLAKNLIVPPHTDHIHRNNTGQTADKRNKWCQRVDLVSVNRLIRPRLRFVKVRNAQIKR